MRYIFGFLLLAMGLHTIWLALRATPLVIGYGDGNKVNIPDPKWYQRALWLSVGVVFLLGAAIFLSGSHGKAVGIVIGLAVSTWASFTFLRCSISGAPPLYSHGLFKRSMHFLAGIIFGSLAIEIALMLARK